MTRLDELQSQRRTIDAKIDEECPRLQQKAHEQPCRDCTFTGFDPDFPDIPMD